MFDLGLLNEISDQRNEIQAAIDAAELKEVPAEQLCELRYALARTSFYRDTIFFHAEQMLKKQGKMSNDNRQCNEDSDEDIIEKFSYSPFAIQQQVQQIMNYPAELDQLMDSLVVQYITNNLHLLCSLLLSNPTALQELMHNYDHALSNRESMTCGFNALQCIYHDA